MTQRQQLCPRVKFPPLRSRAEHLGQSHRPRKRTLLLSGPVQQMTQPSRLKLSVDLISKNVTQVHKVTLPYLTRCIMITYVGAPGACLWAATLNTTPLPAHTPRAGYLAGRGGWSVRQHSASVLALVATKTWPD